MPSNTEVYLSVLEKEGLKERKHGPHMNTITVPFTWGMKMTVWPQRMEVQD